MRVVFHGFVKNLRRENLQIDLQDILVGKVDALDHSHVAIVGYTGGFADGERCLRKNVHGVDHKGVAFPVSDRMPVECRVRNVRMSASVSVDTTYPVAIQLPEHSHAARREQDFHRVMCNQHPRRVRLGQAVGEDQAGSPSLLLGEHVLDLLCGNFIPGRRVGFDLRILVADFRVPHTTPIGKLAEVCPILGGRSCIDN